MQAANKLKKAVRNTSVKLFSSAMSKVKLKENSILLIESSFPSGSNTKILLDELQKTYTVEVIKEKDIYKPLTGFGSLKQRLSTVAFISKFPVIVTSHGFSKLNKNQTLINLWHGIPLKSMGKMEMQAAGLPSKEFNMDYLIMTSKMQSVLMSSCIHVEYSRQQLLGNPRNDYMYENNTNTLKLITENKQFEKVILYMPTFRQGYANRSEGLIADDIFNFDNREKENRLIDFIQQNNYLLIIKLHPQEEALLEEKFKKLNNPNILVLKNDILLENDLDIYQILPDIDLLITDYSSIYFDFLLLDKPILFINNDLEMYKETRGLLLEPYDFWTPGYKAQNYDELQDRIEKSLKNDVHQEKRQELKDVFHLHQDGKSSERVIDLIHQQFKR